MNKIYAKELPPEYCDSRYLYNEDEFFKENIILVENRDFKKYGDYADSLENAKKYSDDEEMFNFLLQIYTGKIWNKTTIYGCCQSDWQDCYYSNQVSQDDLSLFETYYFNTGTEYEISYDDNFEEPLEWYYCTSLKHRDEIADIYGVNKDDVILFKFDGYRKIPTWKEV